MRVVWLTRFGDPSVLVPGEAPDPEPAAGQVLVDVAYANITFIETMFRAKGFGPFKGEFPMVPGNGVGGVVTAVGPGADPALVGTRVVTSTGGSGGYASRVAVDAEGLVPVPDGLGLDTAVALLADGRTALLLLRKAAPKPGERVLVEAAAGGVGTLLVQLAKAAGATVTGAASTAKLGHVGADRAVDYTAPGWAHGVGPLDVVFDGVGGEVARAAFAQLAPGGRMLSYGLSSGAWSDVTDDEAAARGVTLIRGVTGTPEELRALSAEALRLSAQGQLRPVIGQRFPLERAADAHTAIEARSTVGKTLLVP
ncbi:NADPH:quinone reductase [Asanoa ishikariensis]|uniref:NADPH2:quinone reductase n=1 Tax=Asanoa ishikariensis TaxID=137265 RepID=A0A1H3MZF6_9ACTN|nr:zinc-binding dehydrogenase [Asanoa ishikariensis]GIF68948.1 NADPH:quinone reductase [Asanoa ishikariensis]SDY82057.1 NADPH2:quinone reductase [Asanoa ishikariensis]